MSRRVLCLYGWKALMVSYHLSIFVGHCSSASGDIMYLLCHMTSQDCMIERSCNFMSWSSSFYVPNLLSLVVIGNVVVKT